MVARLRAGHDLVLRRPGQAALLVLIDDGPFDAIEPLVCAAARQAGPLRGLPRRRAVQGSVEVEPCVEAGAGSQHAPEQAARALGAGGDPPEPCDQAQRAPRVITDSLEEQLELEHAHVAHERPAMGRAFAGRFFRVQGSGLAHPPILPR